MSELEHRQNRSTGILRFVQGVLIAAGVWFLIGLGFSAFRDHQERQDPQRDATAVGARAQPASMKDSAAVVAEKAREALARPDYIIVDVLGDEGCMQIGDYCVTVHCTFQNVGKAAGETEVRAKLMALDKKTVLAVRSQTLTLMPSRVQRISFDFREAELDWKFYSRCEVD
jgi:hypothetical protein